jgi:hypothetical protein
MARGASTTRTIFRNCDVDTGERADWVVVWGVKVLVIVLFDFLEVDGLEGEGEHLIAVVLVELTDV